jgi:hypothetical protein
MTILLRTRIFRDEAASDYSADLDAIRKWRMADHSVGWAVGLFGEVVSDSAIAHEKLGMVAPVASRGRLGKQPSSKLRIMLASEVFRNVSFRRRPTARGGWFNEDGYGLS